MSELKLSDFELIVCDIDGTLIQDYSRGFDKRLFKQIEDFLARGVKFAIATGRQYPNVSRLMREFLKEIYIISENGACLFFADELIHYTAFPFNDAQTLIEAISIAPTTEPMVSLPRMGYYNNPSNLYRQTLIELEGYDMQDIRDWQTIPEPIVKVTAFVPGNSLDMVEYFQNPWSKTYNMAVAGEHWIDFTITDKGTCLAALCRNLKISPEKVLVFGDNFNDISMFNFTPNSFAMPASHPEVKKFAKLGVCENISDLFAELLAD